MDEGVEPYMSTVRRASPNGPAAQTAEPDAPPPAARAASTQSAADTFSKARPSSRAPAVFRPGVIPEGFALRPASAIRLKVDDSTPAAPLTYRDVPSDGRFRPRIDLINSEDGAARVSIDPLKKGLVSLNGRVKF